MIPLESQWDLSILIMFDKTAKKLKISLGPKLY